MFTKNKNINSKGTKTIRIVSLLLLSAVMMLSFSVFASARTVTHYVTPGETLWIISRKYQVNFTDILKANRHLSNPNMIFPKQQIYVPLPDSNPGKVPQTTNPKPTTPAPTTPNTNQSGNGQVSSYEQQVVDLVNVQRSKHGLAALKLNVELSRVARIKSEDMKANNYFAHNSPKYGTPFDMIKSFGISYRTAGENIARGQSTPQQVVDAWMNSEGHRANILNAGFTQIGVGHVASGNYWTQMFIG